MCFSKHSHLASFLVTVTLACGVGNESNNPERNLMKVQCNGKDKDFEATLQTGQILHGYLVSLPGAPQCSNLQNGNIHLHCGFQLEASLLSWYCAVDRVCVSDMCKCSEFSPQHHTYTHMHVHTHMHICIYDYVFITKI